MRTVTILVSFLLAIAFVSSAFAERKADSIAVQARLTDGSDAPVSDGTKDLTISIWTDSVGGTMLYSETVVVNTKKGLFSTCLGCNNAAFFDIFTDLSLYVQYQLAGQAPMTPRTVIRNVPSAAVASRVRGDIETSHGALRVTGSSTTNNVVITGDPDFDLLRMSADADSAKIRISGQITGDPDFDLLRIQGGVGLNSRGAIMSITGDPDFDLLRLSADADSAKIRISAKSTGDPDFDLLRIAGGSGASHLSMHSAPSNAIGVSNSWKDEDCDGISARSVLGGMSGSTTGTIRQMVNPDSAVSVLDHDSDGDGNPEVMIESKVGLGVAGGAVPGASILSSALNSSGARIAGSSIGINEKLPYAQLFTDTDGDGVMESEFEQTCTPESLLQISRIGGGGGGAGGSSYTMRTRINELENVLKNIGLLGTSKLTGRCDNDSAVTTASFTSATGSSTAWQKVDNSEAQCGASKDLDQDGHQDVVVSAAASSTRSELKGYFQTGDVPTQSQFSTMLDATGGRSLLSSGMSGSTTATIRMQATPDSTVFDLGYSGSTTGTIRLQANSTGSANPLEHSSGAHLTVGGVWTNASDENLKENFQSVDGEELLEKIDELPIHRWNYKNESDEVTHIGPTAQDFQKVFGVGENDKTISTIDPSGIALAAIKELNKKVKEVDQLKSEVQELKALVRKLAADKSAENASR